MSVTLEIYTSTHAELWDRTVDDSINGNFLHKRSFYDANPQNESDDHSFLFFKKGKPIALLPGVLFKKDTSSVFNSHLRSTYGGFIVTNKVGILEALSMVELLIETLKGLYVTEMIIRNPFRILYRQLSDELEYAMWYHGFRVSDRQLEIYIDLNESIENIRSRYDNGTKYNIKKARNFVETRYSDLSESTHFWPMLEKNLYQKFGKTPVHTLRQFEMLIEKCGKDNFQFHGVYREDQLIGGCVLFAFNKLCLHAQYIAQNDDFQEYRGLSALMDHLVEFGCRNGFKYLNLGTANEGGKVINTGLFHFKESFGGRGVLRETHRLILNE